MSEKREYSILWKPTKPASEVAPKSEPATEAREQELLRLLLRLHRWFEESAPEHYKGCGLHIDVKAALNINDPNERDDDDRF